MSSALRGLVAAALLLGCAEPGPPGSSGVGQFVLAGVVGGVGEQPTVHWQYGFRFAVDPGGRGAARRG